MPALLNLYCRLIVTSGLPNRVIFSNAAFSRLTGLETGQILGQPFSCLVDPKQCDELAQCAQSSSTGQHQKMGIRKVSEGIEEEIISLRVKVVPIVARRTLLDEFTQVTHFAIDLLSCYESKPMNRQPVASQTVSGRHLAVGVMG